MMFILVVVVVVSNIMKMMKITWLPEMKPPRQVQDTCKMLFTERPWQNECTNLVQAQIIFIHFRAVPST